MSNLGRFGVRRLAAIGFALTAPVGVLILPSTPSGASGAIPCTPYTCGYDPGTGAISFTVKQVAHMTLQVEATTWPPVIGQTDFIRWNTTLQEDITAGKVIVDMRGPNGPIQGVSPLCGAGPDSATRTVAIPASGPNVWAGGFAVWPVGTPASTPIPPCPIKGQGGVSYDTGLVPFTISKAVQPGTYAGTVQVIDQTSSTVLLTSWQMLLLPCAQLAGCNLNGVNLSPAPNGTTTNLSGADLSNANLNRANLSGENLSNANLSLTNLNGANLTNANLDGATTTGANFNKVTWSDTTCPDGTLSSASTPQNCVGHLTAF
ncbi:MAG: pentapeptide repeat-containing protein [Acidimicrobiales bacterium]